MTASIPREPLVSVVMAVKNGGELMREAVDSILNQTFTDFEFIIINDGSTDNTLEILSEYQDPRIQVYSQENRGTARSANRGLAIACGKFIARQDHDDISLPTRLQKQVEYLEAHPECGLLGTAAEIVSPAGPTGRYHDHPADDQVLKIELIFDNPFVHTSCMFRREKIKKVGLYTPLRNIAPLDDYEFIARFSRYCKVANLQERLVLYREISGSLTSDYRIASIQSKKGYQNQKAMIIADHIRQILNLEREDRRCNVFGAILAFKKIDPMQVKFIDIVSIYKDAFKNINPIYSPTVSKILEVKLDHLRYCYFSVSGLARLHETIFHNIEYTQKPYINKVLIKFRIVFYSSKLQVMAFLSIVKKYFFKP